MGECFFRAAAWILLAHFLLTGPARAIDSASVRIETTDGGEWSAEGIEARLEFGDTERIAVAASIDRLSLPEPIGELRGISIQCPDLRLERNEYRCAEATARIGESMLDKDVVFHARLRYLPATGELRVRSIDVPAMGHRLAVDGQWRPSGWSADLKVDGVDAGSAYPQLLALLPALPEATVDAGTISVDASVSSRDGAAPIGRVALSIANLAINNDSGTLAADALGATITVHVEPGATAAQPTYRFEMHADTGEAYLEPAYFNLVATPLNIDSRGSINLKARTLQIDALDYEHTGAVSASATATLGFGADVSVDAATLAVHDALFPATYKTYVQGFLVGTPLSKLETSGSGQARFVLADGRLQSAAVRFESLNADDVDKRIAVYGASGDVHWSRDGAGRDTPSRIHWDGGFMYAIGYGAATMHLAIGADDIALLERLRVPVLDGALVIDTFEAQGLRAKRPVVVLDATLEPIGLRRLTAAMDLPLFPGTVSGALPMLSLRDGVITLGGSLEARIFDGTATIAGLRVEQPFSANRRAAADVTLDGLDLSLLTDVVTLGRIEGRLDGRIDNLLLVADKPVAFDAKFYTPVDDKGRRRISRRAVSNLSEIAGGGAALLSGGFLRFFEHFRYRSLGIGCRLEDDVCLMSGIDAAEDGYYLVQGAGLPRIDVIGHARAVNWSRLVAQIEEALQSQDKTQ